MSDSTSSYSQSPACSSSPPHSNDLDALKQKLEKVEAEKNLLQLQIEFHKKYNTDQKFIQYASFYKKQLDEQKISNEIQISELRTKFNRKFEADLLNQAKLKKKWMNDYEQIKNASEQKEVQLIQGINFF